MPRAAWLDASYDVCGEGPRDGRFRESFEPGDGFYLSGIETEDEYPFEAYLRLQGGGVICLVSSVPGALKEYYDGLTPAELAQQGLTVETVRTTIANLCNANL